MCFLPALTVRVCFLQPCFADVEFPESNFVDQVELLLKNPEEKEKFFQVCMFLYLCGHGSAKNMGV